MQRTLLIAALILTPFLSARAASDAFLKFDGVEGESTATAPATTSATLAPAATSTAPGTVNVNLVVESSFGVVGKPFVLDGSRSTDDGAISSFRWVQVEGPTVRFSNAGEENLSVTPTVAGTYVFDLVVTDATGRSSKVKSEKFIIGDEPPVDAAGAAVTAQPQKGSTDALLKIDTIKGESAEGQQPEQPPLEVAPAPEPVMPDFSILLGGGSSEEGRAKAEEILLQGMQDEGVPAEQVSLNFEKIKMKVVQPAKLFGVIPLSMKAEVEIDADENVKVRFPWWSFLTRGGDEASLGARVFTAVSNVLKTKHDTIKNSIGNIR